MSCEKCEFYRKDADEADRDRREANLHFVGLLEQKEKEILRLQARIDQLENLSRIAAEALENR